jgi:hypothetical protein
VVCVLDGALGNVTGSMGSRGYNTAWDNGDYWGHIGYPSDPSGGSVETLAVDTVGALHDHLGVSVYLTRPTQTRTRRS